MAYLAVVVYAVITAFPVIAQTERPVVRVDGFIAASADPRLSGLRSTIEDNVVLTLRLMGRFEVVAESGEDGATGPGDDGRSLHDRAVARGYDNIISGGCAVVDGGYAVSISAYDLAGDTIVFERTETVRSLLDTFDTVDALTVAMVEGFSGIRVTYGEILVIEPGTGEPYDLTINGVEVSANRSELERIPAGVHLLVFSQDRPYGGIVEDIPVSVATDQRTVVYAPIPELSPEEASLLATAVRAAQDRLVTGADASSEVEAATDLLDSEFFRRYRSGLAQRYTDWFTAVETYVDTPTDRPPRPTRAIPTVLGFPEGPVGYVRSELPYEMALSGHLDTQRMLETFNPGYIPEYATIEIDGDSSDWEGVPSFADPAGDIHSTNPNAQQGGDIVEVRYARDHDYLYMMLRTADATYRRSDLSYKMHFRNGNAGLFFDFWPEFDTRPWVGYDPTSRGDVPDTEWTAMKNSMRAAIREGTEDAIIEAAIPLDRLVTWPSFIPTLGVWVASYYGPPSRHSELDSIRNADMPWKLIIPVVDILVDHDALDAGTAIQ